jgi:hypothetical protein
MARIRQGPPGSSTATLLTLRILTARTRDIMMRA